MAGKLLAFIDCRVNISSKWFIPPVRSPILVCCMTALCSNCSRMSANCWLNLIMSNVRSYLFARASLRISLRVENRL